MRLEDQVIGLDQAKRLKELGIAQSSLFYHIFNTIPEVGYEGCKMRANPIDAGVVRYYSAFTVAELGLMLPDVYNHEFVWASFPDAGITEEGLDIDPPAFSIFIGPSVRHLEEEPFDNKVYPTEAQARAAFLIYCIENNKTTVAEVNHRLSPSSDK